MQKEIKTAMQRRAFRQSWGDEKSPDNRSIEMFEIHNEDGVVSTTKTFQQVSAFCLLHGDKYAGISPRLAYKSRHESRIFGYPGFDVKPRVLVA